MAYERHVWGANERITAEKLNNIEEGIAEAAQSGGGGSKKYRHHLLLEYNKPNQDDSVLGIPHSVMSFYLDFDYEDKLTSENIVSSITAMLHNKFFKYFDLNSYNQQQISLGLTGRAYLIESEERVLIKSNNHYYLGNTDGYLTVQNLNLVYSLQSYDDGNQMVTEEYVDINIDMLEDSTVNLNLGVPLEFFDTEYLTVSDVVEEL